MSRFSSVLFAVGFGLFAFLVTSCNKNDGLLDEPTQERLKEEAPEGVYRIEVTKLEKGTSYIPLLQFMGEYNSSSCTPALGHIADSVYNHMKEWHPEMAAYKKWHIELLYGDYPSLFQSTIVFETTPKAHGANAYLSSLPVDRSSIEGKKEGYNFKGYFNGKLVKDETLYLEPNSMILDLSLGNFSKDVSRVEKQEERKSN